MRFFWGFWGRRPFDPTRSTLNAPINTDGKDTAESVDRWLRMRSRLGFVG